jgi:hypothetical protein
MIRGGMDWGGDEDFSHRAVVALSPNNLTKMKEEMV